MNRFLSLSTLVVGCILLTGCSAEIGTDYGASEGYFARRSLNGVTTFRQAFRQAGWEDRKVARLTGRIRNIDTIVWTPTHPTPIGAATNRWMESWLSQPGRTLIYVIPDSGSEADFFREARPSADPSQRLEYRRRYGEALNRQHAWQLHRTTLPSNGWFVAMPEVRRVDVGDVVPQSRDGEITGEDSTRVNGEETAEAKSDGAGGISGESDVERLVEWHLEEYDSDNAEHQGSLIWEQVGPGPYFLEYSQDSTVSATETSFVPVVNGSDGRTIVARIESDRWPKSQVLVVAAGSMLTNFALTKDYGQRLAVSLIDSAQEIRNQSMPAVSAESDEATAEPEPPLVGFANANGSMPVSKHVGDIPRAVGAELLTVFPISFVTIHIALLGIIICLCLMPIFGRPRRSVERELADFGDHLDAVATLMYRRGGESFAKRKISDYMRHVRGETSGPWVVEETKQIIMPPSIQLPVAKNTPSKASNQDSHPSEEDS
ncbi:MAG: hypothetical protein AAF802_23190 [Planctomycetota bacterium]